jgi:hypothetical protein
VARSQEIKSPHEYPEIDPSLPGPGSVRSSLSEGEEFRLDRPPAIELVLGALGFGFLR